MKVKDFPKEIQEYLIPIQSTSMAYRCLGCHKEYDITKLLYTCPDCNEVLLIYDTNFKRYGKVTGETRNKIFDYRKMLPFPQLRGIFRYYEFIAPLIDLKSIIYLGEGSTPLVKANDYLRELAGFRFFFKNDGQNPSASFKDRGMACALSYINFLLHNSLITDVLAICASTGDTSAAAALYSSYLGPNVKSAVILPQGKVTPQQLSQPLGNGTVVIEMPGVFDDCMKVVEALTEKYNVALLNSKNAWRILGQESYSYEIAQDLEYDMEKVLVVVPIGNAGNVTAIMSGFIKFFNAGVIRYLPKIIGVQSKNANPVYRHYLEPDSRDREFISVDVKPSVAQAAMIGNPVSMPRVRRLVRLYNDMAKGKSVYFVEVREQDIMDWMLTANKSGHIACTHGGESLAGAVKAKEQGIIKEEDIVVVKSTAHPLKFAGFQDMYFRSAFPPEYGIISNPKLQNHPILAQPKELGDKIPKPGSPLTGDSLKHFVEAVSLDIAKKLNLQKK